MRDFTVRKGVRGYVVQIGCQIAGFSTKEDVIQAITEYILNPEVTENKYYTPCIPQDVPPSQQLVSQYAVPVVGSVENMIYDPPPASSVNTFMDCPGSLLSWHESESWENS